MFAQQPVFYTGQAMETIPPIPVADPETDDFTSWYISYKNSYEDSETSYAGQRSVGSYYNWDFLDDDLQTTVDHDVLIMGFNNGSIDYEITSVADGESAYLLDDDVEIGF
jgi:hypothetical protein